MKRVCFLLLFPFLFCCSSGIKEKAESEAASAPAPVPVKDTSLKRGVVIPDISCRADSLTRYALYLPLSYTAKSQSPVIFFFDSHGSGDYPLEMYKGLAEKYGYILAGSNNSKNGMSWEQNERQIKIFMNDVKERLSIDARRIYACGFSGGSRVASSVAIFDGGIAGVIGMGAGFPSITEPIRYTFDYIGFVGNGDFNLNEMTALDSTLAKTPFRHQLIVFNGKHEWAPAPDAEKGFLWIEVNAMKDRLAPKNESMLKKMLMRADSEIEEYSHSKNIFGKFIVCSRTANFLDGLSDVSVYKKCAEESAASAEMKRALAERDKILKEEALLQQSYRSSFVLKDWSWWQSEINTLQQRSKDRKDQERAGMNRRLLGYLSLVAYMNSTAALQSGQLELAEKFLKIYEKVDPENSEHAYLFAELYAVQKNKTEALTSLKKSVRLGFKDGKRMESDPALLPLRGEEEYKNILNQISGKK